MRTYLRRTLALLVLGATLACAQNTSDDFGTPAGTERLSNTTAFVDVVGLKLGMPAESALAFLKSHYPALKINLERTQDFDHIFNSNDQRDDPRKKFVYLMTAGPTADQPDYFSVGVSLPPSKQVVHTIHHRLAFSAPVAIMNVIDGLRKKYGPETVGPDNYTFFNTPFDRTLVWVFDMQGRRLPKEALPPNQYCTTSEGDMGKPDLKLRQSVNGDDRNYSRDNIKNQWCRQFVVITAEINSTVNTPTMQGGSATSMSVTAASWPVVTSAANSLYAYIDQIQRGMANKAMKEAQQRGGDIKY